MRLDPRSVTITEHQMRDQLVDPTVFGIDGPPKPGLVVQAAKLSAAIAGADGELSLRERDALRASARFWGATEAEAEEVARFEPRGAPVESLLTDMNRKLAAVLVHDGVRIARIDGFNDRERLAATRAAKAVGLDATLIPAIEGLLLVDDALRDNRASLLAPPGAQMTRDARVRVAKAVLVVAAGDGELSDAEMRWFLGQRRAAGADDDELEEILKFDPVGARIDEVLGASLMPFARSIVYDAVRTARADGLHDKERLVAERAMRALELRPEFFAALSSQLRAEDALRWARFHLLRPR